VRVLVVDDHPHYREGLVTALAAIPEVEVVGEAGDGREAVELAAALEPDVVVMDLKLPELNGIDATREIVARRPATAVLVLTMLEGDDSVFAAMRAGGPGLPAQGRGPEGDRPGARHRPQRRSWPGSPRVGTGCGPLLRADGTRAGDPRPGGPRPDQLSHRGTAGPVREDGAQPRLRRLHQAARGRPQPRSRPGTRRRARSRPAVMTWVPCQLAGLGRSRRRSCSGSAISSISTTLPSSTVKPRTTWLPAGCPDGCCVAVEEGEPRRAGPPGEGSGDGSGAVHLARRPSSTRSRTWTGPRTCSAACSAPSPCWTRRTTSRSAPTASRSAWTARPRPGHVRVGRLLARRRHPPEPGGATRLQSHRAAGRPGRGQGKLITTVTDADDNVIGMLQEA